MDKTVECRLASWGSAIARNLVDRGGRDRLHITPRDGPNSRSPTFTIVEQCRRGRAYAPSS